MNMKRLNSAIVTGTLLLGASLSAAAATLASGPVGAGDQNRVICEVYNANNTPITFVSTQIRDLFVGNVPLNFNSCGRSLGPNGFCNFQTAVTTDQETFACKVVINVLTGL